MKRRPMKPEPLGAPKTVGVLIKQLRGITGHLARRDRTLVLESVEAILELSTRLHEATHVEPKPRAGRVKIQAIDVAEVTTEVAADERAWQRQAADDEADGQAQP